MDGRIITVRLELEFKEGEHFNLLRKNITDDEAVHQAEDSYLGWLDTWCGKSKNSIREYLQSEIEPHVFNTSVS